MIRQQESTVCKRLARRGLTLIELIVVLVILVALAGIVIPLLPSMLQRTHTSTGATNIGEINRIVQTYEQLNQGYPNDLDNLVETGGALVDYLPGGTVGGQMSVGTLTKEQASALISAGISRVSNLTATKAAVLTAGGSVTFNPYGATPASTAVAENVKVAFLSEAAVEGLGGPVRDEPGTTNAGDVYVALGFGGRSTAVGKSVSDPPTHFGENGASSAASVYSRFLLVFRVSRGVAGTATPIERAVFVGAVSMHDDGIAGADNHLQEYYKIGQ